MSMRRKIVPVKRSLWLAPDGRSVQIIDQTKLPHAVAIVRLRSIEDAAHAITSMQVRGAPLIGDTAVQAVNRLLASGYSNMRVAYMRDAVLGRERCTVCTVGTMSTGTLSTFCTVSTSSTTSSQDSVCPD